MEEAAGEDAILAGGTLRAVDFARVRIVEHVADRFELGYPYAAEQERAQRRRDEAHRGRQEAHPVDSQRAPRPGLDHRGEDRRDERQQHDREDQLVGRQEKHEHDDEEPAQTGADHVPEVGRVDAVAVGHETHTDVGRGEKERNAVYHVVRADPEQLRRVRPEKHRIERNPLRHDMRHRDQR